MKNYDSINHVAWTEPRIQFIKNQLENLLQIVDLESKGEVVEIDGFRLKDPSMWRSSLPQSILDNFGTLSSVCNCNCDFCYEKGLSKISNKLVFFPKRSMLTLQEAKTRAKYYDPETQTGLFVTAADSLEPTLNPDWINILRTAREKCPNEILDLPNTNGTKLTEEIIKQLSELKPITINISLHSINPLTRKQLMHDPNPEIAIQSIPLLKKYGIPFRIGIVPWYTIPITEIKETIKYADHYDALEIQIELPGFTQFGFESPPFNTKQQWNNIVSTVKSMRLLIQTPLYTSPYAYEVNGDPSAVVVGIVKNSPAANADLHIGDRILEINGKKVFTRSYCNDLLRKTSKGQLQIKILRNRKIREINMDCKQEDKEKNLYPYKPSGYPIDPFHQYGIFMPESFRLEYIIQIENIINNYNSKNVLIFASKLIAPYFKKILQVFKRQGHFKNVKIYVETPKNIFWGGNICIGDLLTVSDYVNCIEEFLLKKKVKPDLLLIPSSGFSNWGRDIIGRNFLEIEQQFNIPVELVKSLIIWR